MTAQPAGEPLVSLVIPVYNGARFIARAIESVLAQSYGNWECLINDNHSTDATLEVVGRYVAADSRFRVRGNDEFVRAQRNHNIALGRISPDARYVKVLFADDWLYPDCLRSMVQLAEQQPGVGLVGAYGISHRRILWQGLPLDQQVLSGRDMGRHRLLGGEYVFGTPTSLLMRADLVRRHPDLYEEDNEHADTAACFALLRECDFGFVHQILTYTQEDDESITAGARKINSYLPSSIQDLITFGPSFLTGTEQARQIEQRLRIYYRFLARCVLRRQSAGFWSYHEKQLASLGHPLNRLRLSGQVLALIADLMLNPKRSLQALWQGRGSQG